MSAATEMNSTVYGVMAEFDTPTDLVHAAKSAYDAGYRNMDTYTPYPLEEAAEAIGIHDNKVSLVLLIGAMFGMCGGEGFQYWGSPVSSPPHIGGKAVFSWAGFLSLSFLFTIL